MKIMNNKKRRGPVLVLLVVSLVLISIASIFSLNMVFAQTPFGGGQSPSFSGSTPRAFGLSINPQFNNPSFYNVREYTNPEVYWPKYNQGDCLERQDFVMQIAPGGCSPSVVSSDLLEEQNVPVFCKIMSIQVNPLIDISKIRGLNFRGTDYPPGVSGISYFPARAGLRSHRELVSSPVENNLGYLVIQLSRARNQKGYGIEEALPDFVEGNITATIDYDVEGAFGIGNTNFYVPELSDDEWNRDYEQYGFWNGKGFIRVDSLDEQGATISVYRDQSGKEATVSLRRGEKSQDIHLGGFYCAAGMNLQLEKIQVPVEAAQLQIDDEQMWVAQGDVIPIDGKKCRIKRLNIYAGGGSVEVDCNVQNGRFALSIESGKADLSVNGGEFTNYSVGSRVIEDPNGGDIYLAYVGEDNDNNPFVVLVNDSFSENVVQFADKELYGVIDEVVTESWKSLTDEFWTVRKIWQELSMDIGSAVDKAYSKKLQGVSEKVRRDRVKVKVVIPGEGSWGIEVGDTSIIRDRNWESEIDEKSLLAKEYYDQSVEYYEDLADIYPNERKIEGEDSFAAQGLLQASNLAKKFGMDAKSHDLVERLVREHERSSFYEYALRQREILTKYDSENAKALVSLNGESHFFEVLDFKKPTREEASVSLLVTAEGKTHEVTLGVNEIEDVEIGGRGEGEGGGAKRWITFQLDNLEEDKAFLRVAQVGANLLATGSNTETVGVGDSFVFKNVLFKVANINLKKQAKIKIIPKRYKPRTQTEFKFKIGIEKRAVQLTPEKTEELIGKLDNLIEDWTEVNDKLYNVVETMKGACLATSAAFTLKNLVDGLSGEALARGKVMTGNDGWNDFCENLVGDKVRSDITNNVYTNVQKCLFEHNEYIEADVKAYAKIIQGENDNLESIQRNVGTVSSDLLDFERQVSGEEVRNKYYEQHFSSYYEEHKEDVITLTDGREVKLMDIIPKKEEASLSDMKSLMAFNSLGGSKPNSMLDSVLKAELGRDLLYTFEINQENQGADEIREGFSKYFSDPKTVRLSGDRVAYTEMNTLQESDIQKLKQDGVDFDLKRGTKVVSYRVPNKAYYVPKGGPNFRTPGSFQVTKEDILYQPGTALVREGSKLNPFESYDWPGNNENVMGDLAGKKVLVVLEPDGKEYVPAAAYSLNEDRNTFEKVDDNGEFFGYLSEKGADRFAEVNQKAYENRMSGNPKVKYFEKEPYKGLPAEVPFDREKGWYVEMTYVLSGFGKPYDDSARPVNFWICNVGENKRIQFKQSADDICRYYNGRSGADLGFPGMNEGHSKALIQKAQQAIAEAGRQYGKDKIKIGGDAFGAGISFGGEEGRCSDFMSPADCHIIFNVCDPVICPTSRCDLGGKYPVDNVINSGIIGSLFLCLPNAKEGIAVPICLSGVRAGIEGYLSVLRGGQTCLQESLETGRHVGFCDTLTSIYLCKLFWKEASPFLNALIPRAFESLFSQGVRGGGEYSTVQAAWDNTQNAVDYFKNEYAVNSLEAFNKRSTEEFGDEVCGSFMSVRYPNSADWFDNLVEPDSPVQFHAWFSEDVLTTATIPSTSHYKATFHIYAGNDQGVYYTVYLKDLPESSYVHTSQIMFVPEGQGYLPRGSSITKAKDFTAVSGYKQLCVSINGQEECGFKQVSTSYALDTLSERYAADQADAVNIKTEEECVAGTPSVKAMLQPNLQAGFGEFLNPELYNRGIIRVCASENPGKQVNPSGEYVTGLSITDRWKPVGYCGDPTIECWLDQDSVKDVIHDKGLEQQVLDETNLNAIGEIDFITPKDSLSLIKEVEKIILQLVGDMKTTLKIASLVLSLDRGIDISENKDFLEIVDKIDRVINAGATNKERARAIFLKARLYNQMATMTLPPPTESPEDEVSRNPEGYIYRVYIRDQYVFYVFEDGKWWYRVSDSSDILEFSKNDYTEESEYGLLGGKSVEEGLAELRKFYGSSITYIDRDTLKPLEEKFVVPSGEGEHFQKYAGFYGHVIIQFRDGKVDVPLFGTSYMNLYYKYDSGKGWMWSSTGTDFGSLFDIEKRNFYKDTSEENQKFMSELKSKNFENGLEMFMNRINDKGGFFRNPSILVKVGDEKKVFDQEAYALRTVETFIEELAKLAEKAGVKPEDVVKPDQLTYKDLFFEFEDHKLSTDNMYYRYVGDNKWEFSVMPESEERWHGNLEDWDKFKAFFGLLNSYKAEKEFYIKNLNGKNFKQGVGALFLRTMLDDEGGWWIFDDSDIFIHHRDESFEQSEYGKSYIAWFSTKDLRVISTEDELFRLLEVDYNIYMDEDFDPDAEGSLSFIENLFREGLDVDALSDDELAKGAVIEFSHSSTQTSDVGVVISFWYEDGKWNRDVIDDLLLERVSYFVNEVDNYEYKDGVKFLLEEDNFLEGTVRISDEVVIRRDSENVKEDEDIEDLLITLKALKLAREEGRANAKEALKFIEDTLGFGYMGEGESSPGAVSDFVGNVLGNQEFIDVDSLKEDELEANTEIEFIYHSPKDGGGSYVKMIIVYDYDFKWNYDIADEPIVLKHPAFLNELEALEYEDSYKKGVILLLKEENFEGGLIRINGKTIITRDFEDVNEAADVQNLLQVLMNPEGEIVLDFEDTLGKSCTSDKDCASECVDGEITMTDCFEEGFVCRRFEQYEAKCLDGDRCITSPKVFGGKKRNYGYCESLKINCDKLIRIYDASSSAQLAVFDIRGSWFGEHIDSHEVGTNLPVFTGVELAQRFKQVRQACEGESVEIILQAHGQNGEFELFEGSFDTSTCQGSVGTLSRVSPFENGGVLVLNSCGVVQDEEGEEFVKCLSDSLGVRIVAAPCIVDTCSTTICFMGYPVYCTGTSCFLEKEGAEAQIFNPS